MGVCNLPRSNHLRSDSPLYFTLLEHPCAVAWNQVYSAATTPSAQLPTGSKWSLISKSLVDLASPNQCAPSASQSFPQFWLHPDRQFAHLAEQRPTTLSRNVAIYLRELTSFLLSGKSAACEVADTEARFTLRHRSLSVVVARVDTEVATTTPAMLTLCLWLSLDGLQWFVCLIFESSGPGLVFEVGAKTHLRELSRASVWQHDELAHSHSLRHRSNRTAAKLDDNKSSAVQQHAAQSVGASRTEINR